MALLIDQLEGQISSLPVIEQLELVARITRRLTQIKIFNNNDVKKIQPSQTTTLQEVSPIYTIHELAIDAGPEDMSDQFDHYVYGTDKHQ
ncbi:MAG: hypothetical protein KIH69_003605 [Anaerolineae bacterium]|nr:hypothetical protein [Anaerolineae bacterium]